MTFTAEPEVETTSDAGEAAQHLPQVRPSHPSLFEEGEIVIASHCQHFYEAKIEKAVFSESWKYYVHYRGWKRSWDEWVGVDRLMKLTNENAVIISQGNKKVADVKVGHLSPSTLGTTESADAMQKKESAFFSHKRKRKHNKVKGRKCTESVEKLINISVPPVLKKQLMVDFELIKQMGKLSKLPRTPTVDDIVKQYLEHTRNKDDVLPIALGEIFSGICAYFNKALPVMLLYNEERKQFQEAMNENTSPSEIYGAEHLLRLFVKLPGLLYELKIEEDTLLDLQKNLNGFLKFLEINQSVFFLPTHNVPHEHSRRSNDKGCN